MGCEGLECGQAWPRVSALRDCPVISTQAVAHPAHPRGSILLWPLQPQVLPPLHSYVSAWVTRVLTCRVCPSQVPGPARAAGALAGHHRLSFPPAWHCIVFPNPQLICSPWITESPWGRR